MTKSITKIRALIEAHKLCGDMAEAKRLEDWLDRVAKMRAANAWACQDIQDTQGNQS